MKRFLPACAALLCASSTLANSPYISRVFEYCPAPGQFVNELPEYTEGDTYQDILSKVTEQIAGDRTPGLITLGAYGGCVVLGFDHPVLNKQGDYDFKIYGNAIISDRDSRGGSSEPGIVLVSRDANGNGLPDDPWYELAGCEYSNPSTIHGFEITYSAPDPSHSVTPDPDDPSVIDTRYIPWTGNNASRPSGYISRNTFHTQSYWPQWLTGQESLTFSGTLLPDNGENINGDGSYFVLRFYDWGYADNLPNNEDKGFDIDWAVDADGTPVALESIDFVKVYTGVAQTCGRLGESSTEIAGAEDLHPDMTGAVAATRTDGLLLITGRTATSLSLRTDRQDLHYDIYSAAGHKVLAGTLQSGENTLDIAHLPAGLYLLKTPTATLRFLKD